MQVIADKFGPGSLTVDLTRSAVYFTVALGRLISVKAK